MIHEVKLVTDPDEVQNIYEFMKQFPLDYPGYLEWLEKCKRQLELKEKEAFYAVREGRIIGDVVFQTHRQDPATLEIKNLRVAEDARKQGVGSILEALLYSYAKTEGFKRIIGDSHEDNPQVIRFLMKHGYHIETREYLYSPEQVEVILAKRL